MVDHVHIFWFCPSFQMFWKIVGTIITVVLVFNIDITFASLFFGLIPDGLNNKILLATGGELSQSIGYRKMDLL